MTRVRWMNPKNAVVEDKRGRLHIEEMNGGKKEEVKDIHFLAMSVDRRHPRISFYAKNKCKMSANANILHFGF